MTFDQPLPPPPGKSVIVPMLAVLTIACLIFFPLYAQSFRSSNLDFDAFYCGGQVLLHGQNPYIEGPLHACEGPLFFHDPNTQAVIPVPMLGYVIAAFVPLARMDPQVARDVWNVTLFVVLGITFVLVRRITQLPWVPTLLIVMIADAIVSLSLGQIVPICVLGLLIVADALQRNRAWQVVIGMLLLCAQPQAGFPVALALLVYGSLGMRIATLASGLAVLGLSCWAVGFAATKTYILVALPLHAASELVSVHQLSLSSLLFQAGIPSSPALALGTASYAALVLGGVAVAPILARRLGDRAFLALLPAACSVCAGTFVHQQMYAMAIPFGLLAVRYIPLRSVAALLILVAVPWTSVARTLYLWPIAALVCATLSFYWISHSAIRAAIVGLLVAIFCVGAFLSCVASAPAHVPTYHYTIDPNALVQYAWIPLQQATGWIGGSPGITATRLVSILSLAALLVYTPIAATRLGVRSDANA